MFYTVGIKRKWLPGYKKYKVKGHRTEAKILVNLFNAKGEVSEQIGVEHPPSLVLTMRDESQVIIRDILQKDWKLYPDYAHGIAEAMSKINKEAGDQVRSHLGSDNSGPIIGTPAMQGG